VKLELLDTVHIFCLAKNLRLRLPFEGISQLQIVVKIAAAVVVGNSVVDIGMMK